MTWLSARSFFCLCLPKYSEKCGLIGEKFVETEFCYTELECTNPYFTCKDGIFAPYKKVKKCKFLCQKRPIFGQKSNP